MILWRMAFGRPAVLFLLMLWHGMFIGLRRIFRGRGSREGKTRILVIRTDEIGDFFLWLPFARSLRTLYPADRYELTLLGNHAWIKAAGEYLAYDRLIAFDKKRFASEPAYFASIGGQLSGGGYGVVIQPRVSRYLLLDDLLFIWTGAAESWCFRYEYASAYSWKAAVWMRLIDLAYCHKVDIGGIPEELKRNNRFLTALAGGHAISPNADIGSGAFSADGFPLRYFVLLPGAGAPYKVWPAEKFALLAGKIVSETGWDCVVCGSAAEYASGEVIRAAVSDQVFNYCGKTDILEFTGIIKGAAILIGNDTGGIHIAALVGTPSIAVCGLGSFNRFLPYPPDRDFDYLCRPLVARADKNCEGCEWHCRFTSDRNTPFPCVAEISVETLMALVSSLLPGQPD